MPHVTVHFNPKRVEQEVIDRLKKILQRATAEALSSPVTVPGRNPEDEIFTSPDEVYVRQQAAHETDVNPAPIEILVEAGRSKGRDAETVALLLDDEVRSAREGWDPSDLPEGGECCIWVKFCEQNGFRFIKS